MRSFGRSLRRAAQLNRISVKNELALSRRLLWVGSGQNQSVNFFQ